MFTFSLLYVYMYLFIFLALLAFTFTQIPLYVLTNYSTTTVVIFIQKYLPLKNLFFFLVFALTGLPPFGLFFVKFNILTFVLYQTHIFIAIVLFVMFFLNMLYYIQLFNFRNFKVKSYHQFSSTFFTNAQLATNFNTRMTTYDTFILVYIIISILTFVVLSVLLFTDFFLIANVI